MRIEKYVVVSMMFILLVGCATNNKTFETKNEAFIEGEQLIINGEIESGLQLLEQAAREEPESKEIRAVLARQREDIPRLLVFDADHVRLSGDLENAEKMYNRILEVFPRHGRAQAGLDALEQERHHIASIDYAQELLALNDVDGAEKTVRGVLQENPEQPHARQLIKQINTLIVRAESTELALETAFKKPFTIEFQDTELKDVFEIMAKTAGINFVFDKDVRQEAKMSIFVKENSVEDILNLILMTNQLAYKALNKNSLLIYPNTPAKQKEYQELMVRSFHIAYADVKQMVAMVRGLVKAKDIYVNEQLNLFIMRDTLETIRMVERLVALNDLPEPEVMLEVVIMTITRTNDFLIGPNLPKSAFFSGTALIEEGIAQLSNFTASGFKNLAVERSFSVDFSQVFSGADLLANPRIRVKNRETAKIHIGTKEPFFTATVAAGIGGVVSSTPQFIDIGVKLDVEPVIGLYNDVTLKVILEVSVKDGDAEGPNGATAPRISTSNAETMLTLKDGETQVIGGLIRNDEIKSLSGIAGLLNIPGLDRLLGKQNINRIKSELILLITPRVVRNTVPPTNLEGEFHFGTSNMPGKLPVTISKTAASSLAIASAGTGRTKLGPKEISLDFYCSNPYN